MSVPTSKNRILLENYYLPGDPEAQIEAFVTDYNYRRYQESINNLTPADVYLLASAPMMIVVHSSLPAKNMTALIALL